MDCTEFGDINLDNISCDISLDDFDLSMFDNIDDFNDDDVAENYTENETGGCQSGDEDEDEDEFINAIALDLLLKPGERTHIELHNDDVTSIIRTHLSNSDNRKCNWLWLENLLLWQMDDGITLNNFHNIYYVFIFGFSSAPEFFIDNRGRYKHILYQINILNDVVPQEEDIGLVKGLTVNSKRNYIEIILYTDTIKK